MSKIIKRVVLFVSVVVLMILATGCGSQGSVSSPKISATLVLGRHMNFPEVPIMADSIYDVFYDCAASWGTVSMIAVDGNPQVQCDYRMTRPNKAINREKENQLIKNNVKQIINGASNVQAKCEEIDTLKAITVAGNVLQSDKSSAEKKLLIFDSGLSTTGLLNFTESNLIDASPDIIIDQLNYFHALPDLSGISVTWYGLGEVCGEQCELSSSYKYKLQILWNEILDSAGAKNVVFDKVQFNDRESENLPFCSTVPVVEDCLILSEIEDKTMPDIIKFDENTSVKFIGDQADFINPGEATQALLPIADYLIKNPNKILCIVGMTATVGGENDGIDLSLQRAKTCYNALLEMGVDSQQLICKGLGHRPNYLRVKDTDENGNLIESEAKKNRAVYFIDTNSDSYNALMKSEADD